jgi:PAS domain S-box-containing protein
MKDSGKSKNQLLEEIKSLRQRISRLESEKTRLLQLIEKGPKDFEDMSQQYLDIVHTIIVELGRTGNVVQINKRGCEILGYREKEILGKNWFDNFLPKYFGAEVKKVFKELMTGNIKAQEFFENPVLTKNGEERLIAWHNTILKDDSGKITGTLSSGLDITSDFYASKALKESEEKYRAIIETALDGVCIIDAKGKILEVNDSYCEMIGYSHEELLKMSVGDVEQMESAAETRRRLKEFSPTKYDLFETKHRCKDGSSIDLEVAAKYLDRAETRIIAFARDITERKRTEEFLRTSEEFNRVIVERSPIGISVRNKNGKLLSCNKAWQKIWGKTAEDIKRLLSEEKDKLQFSYKDDYLSEYHDILKKIYTKGGYLHVPEAKLLYNTEGGPRWVSQHFYAIINQRNEVDRVVILTEDISDRKRAEEEK